MQCVKCSGTLIAKQVAGVMVDQCDRCGGVWFDARELDRVLQHGQFDDLQTRLSRGVDYDALRGNCPRCKGDGKLVRVVSDVRDDIHIDTCTVCYGQWLDSGEVEALHGQGLIARLRRFFAG